MNRVRILTKRIAKYTKNSTELKNIITEIKKYTRRNQ